MEPYIHVIGPRRASLPESYSLDSGVQYKSQIGVHAVWAARIPFIPSLDSVELTRLGAGRIGQVVRRQFRFLYDLAREQSKQATYELRFIAQQSTNPSEQLGRIEIVFLGKVFVDALSQASPAALELWAKFLSHFPLEDPFNYPVQPVQTQLDFQRLHAPIDFRDLTNFGQIVEIRRFEEMPISDREIALAQPPKYGDYIVHPFVPTLDFSAMGRFFETLAIQPNKCFASVSIRPTKLFPGEIIAVNELASRFRNIGGSTDGVTEYMRSRATFGARTYSELMEEYEFLLQIKVQIVGAPSAPIGLVEALGSELMNNGNNPFPTKWVQINPTNDQEFKTALGNLEYMEHEEWGATIAHPALKRLRSTVNVKQAAGAFRLPIPSENGYMPGVLVKSEPFVAPQDDLEMDATGSDTAGANPTIELGEIIHRGNPTGRKLKVSLASLTRHGLIAGSTGSGKSTTVMALLSQLWQQQPPIPFLVLYPVDKPDYRVLLNDSALRDDLLVFTLGDETTSPFRFNPFAMQPGTLVKTHISRLMRAFGAAFDLYPPLPMIYRDALRRVYQSKGWDVVSGRGGHNNEYPTLEEFHGMIVAITDELKYGKEVLDTIRQASVIRIRDLIENAGHVLNVSGTPNFAKVMNRPVIMEIGRVGSREDTALLMAFLLIALTETLEKDIRKTPHITVVEEAHRLMPEASSHEGAESMSPAASEDFSNILAEIRGFNAGILIAEQMPTKLIKSAIGNTFLKVMHWLEDASSFELFADIMNLNPQQRTYARRLKPGEAIVRSRFGRPVHIQVSPVRFGNGKNPSADGNADNGRQAKFDSVLGDDAWLAANMQRRLSHAGIDLPTPSSTFPVQSWNPANSQEIALRIYTAPKGQFCAFCRPMLQSGNCVYGAEINALRQSDRDPSLDKEALATLAGEQRMDMGVANLSSSISELLPISDEDAEEAAYCLAAHVAREIYTDRKASSDDRIRVKKKLLEFALAINQTT